MPGAQMGQYIDPLTGLGRWSVRDTDDLLRVRTCSAPGARRTKPMANSHPRCDLEERLGVATTLHSIRKDWSGTHRIRHHLAD
jgi:hypothetical protein